MTNTYASNRRILPVVVWATLVALLLLACTYVVSYPVYMRWKFGSDDPPRIDPNDVTTLPPLIDSPFEKVSHWAYQPLEAILDRSLTCRRAMWSLSKAMGAQHAVGEAFGWRMLERSR